MKVILTVLVAGMICIISLDLNLYKYSDGEIQAYFNSKEYDVVSVEVMK
jgi:hypothetical protein